jgi:glucose/arabinose dehydrogenase
VSTVSLRLRGLTLALSVTLVAALGLAAAPAGAEPSLPEGFQDEIVFGNLEQPTNFRFAENGRVFVAEKSGKILVFDSVADTTPEVFADLRGDVYSTGDRGLLGLALDPEFTSGRPYVYGLYTYDHILGDPAPAPKWGTAGNSQDPCPEPDGGDACLVSGRLVRLEAVAGCFVSGQPCHAQTEGSAPKQKELAQGWCQQFSSHSIGDLQFGPDGKLYVSGGDGASFFGADFGQFGNPTPNPCGDPPGPAGTALTPPDAMGGSLRSQNMKLLNGKILRVDPDTGKGLLDNPFGTSLDENEKRVIAAGFRNPFRFAFDPQTDELYTDNVGSSEIEEIGRFEAPPPTLYNSGWPCYEGPERQFQFAGLGLDACEALYSGEPDSTSQPFFYYSHGQSVVPDDECPTEFGSALGGISFYEGDQLPGKYKGALFFSDAVRGCIWTMFPGEDGKPDPATTTRFLRDGRIYPGVDIEEGPGGYLYYADLFGDENYGNGAIHKITYNPGAPTARLSANPPYGPTFPLHVSFDATKSTDPDGDTADLEYDWDMDGNGSFELLDAGPTQEQVYTKAEQEQREANHEPLNRTVTVRVTNGAGLSAVATVTVYPGDEPPVPTIDQPLSTLTWKVGDTIHLHGSAQSFSGKTVDEPLFYYWSTRLFHCPIDPDHCHAHPLQTFSGTRSAEFLAPEHDYPSYIGITLSFADERGLTGTTSIKLQPRTVDLKLNSWPRGVQLTAGLLQDLSPFALTAIEGSTVLLEAPLTATIGGRTYTWSSWSDGGARIHAVAANASGCYQATYVSPDDTSAAGPCVGPDPPVTQPPTSQPPVAVVPADTTAPVAKLLSHPAKKTTSKRAKFSFSANERSDFRCKLDGGPSKACASPVTYRGLKRGAHSFKLIATDAAGNRGKAVTFGWKVLAPKTRRR